MMTTNDQIDTAFHDSAELSLEDLMQVTGGGDTANAVAKVVGAVIGAALFFAEKVAKQFTGPV